jgi:hypothetical protein
VNWITCAAYLNDGSRLPGSEAPAQPPPADQDEVIAARTAASSFATPLANEATRLARARSIQGEFLLSFASDHQVEFGDDLACLDQGWYASFDRRDRDALRFRYSYCSNYN